MGGARFIVEVLLTFWGDVVVGGVFFKAVLSVLIRNFSFSMRDGPETKLDSITTILPRPKVAGEEGYKMPLRVRRVDS